MMGPGERGRERENHDVRARHLMTCRDMTVGMKSFAICEPLALFTKVVEEFGGCCMPLKRHQALINHASLT